MYSIESVYFDTPLTYTTFFLKYYNVK